MKPMTLRKVQAVQLAEKIRPEDEKAQEFCRQLEKTLYETHKDFAENPLLLSMMFLTFMRNSSIPDHLSDFYQKAFDALYSVHDSTDKGSYRRDFSCKALTEESFKRLFAHFCFHSYMDEVYEFTKDDILKQLQNSIHKLNLDTIAKNYLVDLRIAVCMIIKDGDMFRFSHCSFQAYFAAYYTASVLTDEQQKKLFAHLLSMPLAVLKRDYYTLLAQIEPERFAINALADALRKLVEAATRSNNRNEFILKSLCQRVYLSKDRIGIIPQPHSFIVEIFFIDIIHSMSRNFAIKNDSIDVIRGYAEATGHSSISHIFNFSKIDTSDCTEAERERLYSAIISCAGLDNAYQEISDWLSEIDAKSASLKRYNFIDEL